MPDRSGCRNYPPTVLPNALETYGLLQIRHKLPLHIHGCQAPPVCYIASRTLCNIVFARCIFDEPESVELERRLEVGCTALDGFDGESKSGPR